MMKKPSAKPEAGIEIAELGPGKFSLAVSVGGTRFDCGTYLNRAAAQQAARLFIARKQGELAGGRTRRK
jgi:hypothetical protein